MFTLIIKFKKVVGVVMSRNRSKTPVSVPVLYQCVALKSNYSGCSISRVVLVLEVGGVEAGGGTGFRLGWKRCSVSLRLCQEMVQCWE